MTDISDQFNLARLAQRDFEDHARNTFDMVAKIRDIVAVVINSEEAVHHEIDRLVAERQNIAKGLEADKVNADTELEQYKKSELAKVDAELGSHREALRKDIGRAQLTLAQLRDELTRLQANKENAVATMAAEINKEKARLEADLLTVKQQYQQQISVHEHQLESARAAALHASTEFEE